jgi:hypothetical protein
MTQLLIPQTEILYQIELDKVNFPTWTEVESENVPAPFFVDDFILPN